MAGTQPSDEKLAPLIDAALHRYFSRLTRRYVPLVAGLAFLALVAFVLPSKQRSSNSNLATGSRTGGAAAPARSAGSGVGGSAAGGTAAAETPGASDVGSAGASQTGVPGAAEVNQGSASGVARSGAQCGPGVLQVTWTPYAAPCVAAFSGDNGGGTAPGVTADTITITLRHTNDGDAFYPPFDKVVADLQVFLDYFNKNYEFYGRHIVLKTYTGQGLVVQEIQGQGQAGAEADAQTEQDLGSFADIGVAFRVFGSALADHGVMLMGDGFSSEAVLEQYSPYLYANALESTADDFGHAAAATVCQRMQGMPAVFAGDALYQRTDRVFGLVAISQPDMKPAGDVFEQDAQNQCGVSLKKRADYNLDASTEPQQAVAIVAQMKAAGVTTLVAATDPLMFAQITLAAKQADWHPEYVSLDTLGIERNGDADQMSHVIKVSAFGPVPGNGPDSEPGRVFRLASGGTAPQTGDFFFVELYMNLLQFANAVQAAGPNLTPQTFLGGKQVLPDASGEFGLWKRSQLYDESADFVVSRYDPNAPSPTDGKAGVWKVCDGGARYPNQGANMGLGQLGC